MPSRLTRSGGKLVAVHAGADVQHPEQALRHAQRHHQAPAEILRMIGLRAALAAGDALHHHHGCSTGSPGRRRSRWPAGAMPRMIEARGPTAAVTTSSRPSSESSITEPLSPPARRMPDSMTLSSTASRRKRGRERLTDLEDRVQDRLYRYQLRPWRLLLVRRRSRARLPAPPRGDVRSSLPFECNRQRSALLHLQRASRRHISKVQRVQMRDRGQVTAKVLVCQPRRATVADRMRVRSLG